MAFNPLKKPRIQYIANTHQPTHYLLVPLINSAVFSSVIAGTGKYSAKSDYFGKESIVKCI